MNIYNLQNAKDYLKSIFNGDESDFFAEEDHLQEFKPKKFRFQNCLTTRNPISEPSDKDLLLQFLIKFKKEFQNQDENNQNTILTKLLEGKNEEFWTVFLKYDGVVACTKFHIQKLQAIKILPTIGFPTLISISIQEIPFCSFEPFSWIDAPLLLEIRILRCHLTRIDGLDKANFPRLMRIFLAENHMIGYDKMSRIHLSKEIQSSDLRFVIRDRFFELGQPMGDETFYNREQIFASLEEFNDLNFIVKMEALNVVQNCMRILDGYGEVLIYLYIYHILLGQGRGEDKIRAFWRKRPLVQFSFRSLAKRLDDKFYQSQIMFDDQVLRKVQTRFGPVNEWK